MLEILANNQENAFFKSLCSACALRLRAARRWPMPCAPIQIFDDLTTNMIEAGETGGILDLILQRISQYVEKAVKMRLR